MQSSGNSISSLLHPRVVLHTPGTVSTSALGTTVVPGCDHYAGSERFIRKAFGLQAQAAIPFDVTCDCEDGAAVGNERSHAAMLADLVDEECARPSGAKRLLRGRIGLRIHDLSSPYWHKDLEWVLPRVGRHLAYVTVPKVRSLADVITVDRAISALERGAPLAGGRTPIGLNVLIETPSAVLEVNAIAAHPRVQVLDFGLLDFMSEHHGAIPEKCMRSPWQFEHALLRRAKTEIVAAAVAQGKIAAHNITTDLDNPEVAFEDARRAREEFGFLRMWSIHPAQIEPILRAMTPEFSLVERAGRILLEAQRQKWAPLRYEGQLHDRASYRYLWALLERARLFNVRMSSEVEAAFFGAP